MSRFPGACVARFLSFAVGVVALVALVSCGGPPVRQAGPSVAQVAPVANGPPSQSPVLPPGGARDPVADRLRSPEPGCVAISADGASALVVVEARHATRRARELRGLSLTQAGDVRPLGDCDASETEDGSLDTLCAKRFREAVDELLATDALAAWRGAAKPLACEERWVGKPGDDLVLPVGAGVTLAASAFAIVARPTTAPAGAPGESPSISLWSAAEREPEDTAQAELVGAFFTAGRPNFFVELRRRPGESLEDLWTWGVAGSELGVAPCARRPEAPVMGDAIVRPETPPSALAGPRPFDASELGESCLAMTPDGHRAAFRMHRADRFAQGEDERDQGVWIEWFGESPPPAVDLACLADHCTPKQLNGIKRASSALGLVECTPVRDTISIDGVAVPLMQTADALWLRLPDGPLLARRLASSSHDGADHEAFVGFWQAGDGPVFVAVSNADTGLSESRVSVVEEKGLGLCPRGSVNP